MSQLPQNITDTIQSFFTSDQTSERMGRLTVTFGGNNLPVRATDFAEVIESIVSCLKAIAEDEGLAGKYDLSIVEAAIIGDKAMFTLHGYPMEFFEKPKESAA
jgi:hypothetical protein